MRDTLTLIMLARIRSGGKTAVQVLTAAGREYGVDRANRMAAAIAYRLIFAAAPLLLIAASVFGLILGGDIEIQREIISAIERVAGSEVATAFETFLATVVDESASTALVGGVLLLWTASSLFLELQHDLNDIFHVPYEHTAGVVAFIRKRGLGFIWALGLGLGVIALWIVNVAWNWVGALLGDEFQQLGRLIGLLAPIVSLVLLPLLFGLLFQTLTEVKVSARAVWAGSIFTSLAFLLTAYGIGLYFAWDESTSVSQVAASFFVILLLTFILAGVFLYGAVVTKVYNDYLATGDVKPPTVREEEEGAPEVLVSQAPEPKPTLTVLAFLAGLLVGWRRSAR